MGRWSELAVHILNSFKWATDRVCNHTLYLSNQYMQAYIKEGGDFKGVPSLSARINFAQKNIKLKTTVYNIKAQYYVTNFRKYNLHISNERKYHLTFFKNNSSTWSQYEVIWDLHIESIRYCTIKCNILCLLKCILFNF